MSVVISRDELDRMRRLALEEDLGSNLRKDKVRELRERSLAKKKGWSNTLEAIRDRKALPVLVQRWTQYSISLTIAVSVKRREN